MSFENEFWKSNENEGASMKGHLPNEADIKDFKELMLKARSLTRETLGEKSIELGPGFILEIYDRLLTHTQLRHMNAS